MHLMPVTWTSRPEPLDPAAVAALGAPSRALAARLLQLDDSRLRKLRGVAGNHVLVVLGETEDLPWADGVVYLGRDPEAPHLLLPTHLLPSVLANLFERALLRRFPGHTPPIAVLGESGKVIPSAGALAIERLRLQDFLARAS